MKMVNTETGQSDKWNYSKTTLKYLKRFSDTTDSKRDIQKKINGGEYTMVKKLTI